MHVLQSGGGNSKSRHVDVNATAGAGTAPRACHLDLQPPENMDL